MIPFAKDLITVSRVPELDDTDGYEVQQNPSQIASGVRASIALPSAGANLVGGDRIVQNVQMVCDITDLQPNDTVQDGNGTVWTVLTVVPQVGLGLDHLVCNLRYVTGAATA